MYLDVNSGAVHVVDQEAYDVIGALERQNEFHTPETLRAPETAAFLKAELGGRYSEEDLAAAGIQRKIWRTSWKRSPR